MTISAKWFLIAVPSVRSKKNILKFNSSNQYYKNLVVVFMRILGNKPTTSKDIILTFFLKLKLDNLLTSCILFFTENFQKNFKS